MQTLTSPSLQTIDLRHAGFMADPHAALRRLRPHGPLHRDALGIWLVTGHAEARALLTDSRCGRDPRGWKAYAQLRPYLADSTLEQTLERWMLMNDPPVHTRMRRLVSAAFTPAAIRGWEAQIAQTAHRMVQALPPDQPFDFIRDFAQPFPVRVICDLLGLPAEDFSSSKGWSDALALVVEPVATRSLRNASDRAAIEMGAYLQALVARRRAAPQGQLLDHLLAAQQADGGLDDRELIANLMLLFVAGHETTTNLMGNGLHALLQQARGQGPWLGAAGSDTAAMGHLIEEMLRYESAVTVVSRVPSQPIELAGHSVGAGELVYAMVSAANRDPQVFDQPDTFDPGRVHNPHLSFGGGVHYCLGAPLARLEARLAFQALAGRFPVLRLVNDQPVWRPLINLRGLAELEVQAFTGPERPVQRGAIAGCAVSGFSSM